MHAGVPVAKVEKDLLTLKNGEQHPYGLLVWSTGIGPSDLVNKLAVPKDHGKVEQHNPMCTLRLAILLTARFFSFLGKVAAARRGRPPARA